MLDEQHIAAVENKLLNYLNDNAQRIVNTFSPRIVGDALQEFFAEHLQSCFPPQFAAKFETDFERRSMEDMAFYDNAGNYYAIDVKTHDVDTHFSMPNLISMQRLAKFYRNDTNTFCILIVDYKVVTDHIEYLSCHFKPIEYFAWSCLTLGALGWGQIQIKDSNRLLFEPEPSRKRWMLELCEAAAAFYETEIGKIAERKDWFSKEKTYWEQHK